MNQILVSLHIFHYLLLKTGKIKFYLAMFIFTIESWPNSLKMSNAKRKSILHLKTSNSIRSTITHSTSRHELIVSEVGDRRGRTLGPLRLCDNSEGLSWSPLISRSRQRQHLPRQPRESAPELPAHAAVQHEVHRGTHQRHQVHHLTCQNITALFLRVSLLEFLNVFKFMDTVTFLRNVSEFPFKFTHYLKLQCLFNKICCC